MSLLQIAEQLDGELIGEDVAFANISTDTRALTTDDLYLALIGKNFDGNNFIDEAKSKGAAAAIVSRVSEVDLPQLKVPDSHIALGRLANLNRNRSSAKVIALTGSQGKTTVKEMIGSILNNRADTLITNANLNNTIGVPLTLLQIEKNHQFAVIEMGADKAGEIAFSVSAAAHIEGFGSLAGIVSAKGEIIEGLNEAGLVLLNADEAHLDDWLELANKRRTVLFSLKNEAENSNYFASKISSNSSGEMSFTLNSPAGTCEISMQFLGTHNVLNAVAASAAALEAGANLNNVAVGLANLKPVSGRLSPESAQNNCLLINDTYNASPNSFRAAIDVLSSLPGHKILVAGDMKELGEEAETFHKWVGEYAKRAGVNELLAVGEKSLLTANAFGSNGRHFSSRQGLVTVCKSLTNAETVFLIKGSRGARMEFVVNELISDEES